MDVFWKLHYRDNFFLFKVILSGSSSYSFNARQRRPVNHPLDTNFLKNYRGRFKILISDEPQILDPVEAEEQLYANIGSQMRSYSKTNLNLSWFKYIQLLFLYFKLFQESPDMEGVTKFKQPKALLDDSVFDEEITLPSK